MEWIRCEEAHLPAVTAFYHQVVAYLETHINYPSWSDEHPSDESIREAIDHGEQYICMENGEVLGAVVLSEDPDGAYDTVEWSRDLQQGEYLSLHVLASRPDAYCTGIGNFLVDGCIGVARQNGYQALRLDVVPTNTPAERLYRKKGFTYVGTADLKRPTAPIPLFDLYELNMD